MSLECYPVIAIYKGRISSRVAIRLYSSESNETKPVVCFRLLSAKWVRTHKPYNMAIILVQFGVIRVFR
jgi:hypothetical protein